MGLRYRPTILYIKDDVKKNCVYNKQYNVSINGKINVVPEGIYYFIYVYFTILYS